jgi:hypothetical protein
MFLQSGEEGGTYSSYNTVREGLHCYTILLEKADVWNAAEK